MLLVSTCILTNELSMTECILIFYRQVFKMVFFYYLNVRKIYKIKNYLHVINNVGLL